MTSIKFLAVFALILTAANAQRWVLVWADEFNLLKTEYINIT